MIEENEDYLVELKESEELEEQRSEIRKKIRKIEEQLDGADQAGGVIADLEQRASSLVGDAKESLASSDADELSATADKLSQILQSIRSAVQAG